MKRFQVLMPSTAEEAVLLLRENPNARAYAGGTDVIGAMKGQIYPDYPDTLVSLSHIKGLKDIRTEADGIHIELL